MRSLSRSHLLNRFLDVVMIDAVAVQHLQIVQHHEHDVHTVGDQNQAANAASQLKARCRCGNREQGEQKQQKNGCVQGHCTGSSLQRSTGNAKRIIRFSWAHEGIMSELPSRLCCYRACCGEEM